MMVKCLVSSSGYYPNGQPYSFQEGREYEITDSQVLEEQLRLKRAVTVGGQQPASVETATAVADPPKRRRGRPKKAD